MVEPVKNYPDRSEPGGGRAASTGAPPTPPGDSLLARLFGVRRETSAEAPEGGNGQRGSSRALEPGGEGQALREEIGERVSSGFRDLSRLLVAIKETLQDRDGQVRQTLEALPTYLQQVPRIQRAQIECMAQISKQLEHMGTGTRDVLARLDSVPDLLRGLALQQEQTGTFLEDLQARTAEALDVQAKAIQSGLASAREQAETQLGMIRSIAATQEDIFATFQNTQNRALNVFHRAQQQAHAQHQQTQKVLNRQIEMLVEKVHTAQTRVFWLAIAFALVAAAGLVAVLLLG